MNRKTIAALTAAAALAAPAAAGAHVTVQPTELAAGGFARVDVRVPNERDDAGTREVSVKMPPGITAASYEPRRGWDVEITKRKLDKPLELHGEQVTEEIDTVTFTGQDATAIQAGQFVDFGLSIAVPAGDAGTKLQFPATQTYEGGEVVRWIGAEDADQPAPVVTLAAAEGEHGGGAAEGEEAAAAGGAEESAGVSAEEVDDKASKGLAIGGLIVGGLGLLAGIAALVAARRPKAAA
jgi:periplasmic copper chaperone A